MVFLEVQAKLLRLHLPEPRKPTDEIPLKSAVADGQDTEKRTEILQKGRLTDKQITNKWQTWNNEIIRHKNFDREAVVIGAIQSITVGD